MVSKQDDDVNKKHVLPIREEQDGEETEEVLATPILRHTMVQSHH